MSLMLTHSERRKVPERDLCVELLNATEWPSGEGSCRHDVSINFGFPVGGLARGPSIASGEIDLIGLSYPFPK
jgi:hypothetical protein